VLNFRNFTTTFNHRWFENFYMELAFNYSTRDSDGNVVRDRDIRADLNYRMPDGSLNPFFYGNGYYFIESRYTRQTQEHDNRTLRASFSYETGSPQRWWGRHRFALMGERHVFDQTSDRRIHAWAGAPFGGTPEATANQIKRRRYFPTNAPGEQFTAGYNPAGPFLTEEFASANVGRTLTTAWVPANNLNYEDEVTTDSILLVMQNYLLKNRLVLTAGWRHDTIDSISPGTLRDAVTNEWRIASAADQPIFAATGEDWIEETAEKGGRKTVGAVFHVTDQFSLTANVSDNVGVNRRNRTVLPEEAVPDSSRGKGMDYGINFSFLENKISGSIKRYESKTIKEGGQGLVNDAFVNPNNDILRAFDHYFRAAGVTTFGPNDPVGSVDELTTTLFSSANGYLSDRESEGYEFEVIATPTRNWTMRASYANSERSRTNVLREGDAWWAERLTLFGALDATYRNRTGQPSVLNQPLVNADGQVLNQTVGGRIAEAEEDLETTRLQQEQGFGNRRHKATFWTRYTVDSGMLKGLSVGGGWRYQSANVTGINLVTREVYHGNATSLFDLMLSYRTKGIFGRWGERLGVTYQLNVTNLFDDRTIFIAKTATDQVTNQPYTVAAMRQPPRMATLTMRFAF
jgi:iron complex outermembrane recepter protein